MNLKEKFNISPGKVEALLKKMEELAIKPADIEETFVKGSGSGGQKINKTSNGVRLHHVPTGTTVFCQKERERNKNRFLALRLLVEKIGEGLEPGIVPRDKAADKIRKQKARRTRRSKSKGDDARAEKDGDCPI